MSAKYYRCGNATRPVGNTGISFIPYGRFGGWRGVYATDKPEEQVALDSLVSNPTSGVTSITADEYDHLLKKKPTQNHQVSLSSDGLQNPLLQTPIKGNGAVVVESPAEQPAAPPEKPVDLLQIGKVNGPSTETVVTPRRARRNSTPSE